MARWAPVPGYEGLYEVSDDGRVYSFLVGRQLGYMNPDGYRIVKLHKSDKQDGFRVLRVHRLVLLAFVGPAPEGMECRHLNGDPSDNRLSNLRWGTQSENVRDAIRHGTHKGWVVCIRPGEANGGAKLTEVMVREIRRRSARGEAHTSIASDFRVGKTAIQKIAARKTWRHVPEEPTSEAPGG